VKQTVQIEQYQGAAKPTSKCDFYLTKVDDLWLLDMILLQK
jgi:hypothetical protein